MGCTSSAPNTIPPNAHTAGLSEFPDKSIQSEEGTNENPSTEVVVADIEDGNRNNETKVLPACASEESVQLVRNKKSSTSLATEKEPANGHVIESGSVFENPANTQGEIKIPKLELLMDKVLETNKHLGESENRVNETDTPTDSNNDDESTEKKNKQTDSVVETESCDNLDIEVENTSGEGEEETNESSPTQSQSSRATRWEALADIAAELPPSLSVDPVTGQIYQMAQSK